MIRKQLKKQENSTNSSVTIELGGSRVNTESLVLVRIFQIDCGVHYDLSRFYMRRTDVNQS